MWVWLLHPADCLPLPTLCGLLRELAGRVSADGARHRVTSITVRWKCFQELSPKYYFQNELVPLITPAALHPDSSIIENIAFNLVEL